MAIWANIRTAMNRGAFDFLTKPIDFADFETTITKTIRHVEVLREARERQAEAERAYGRLRRFLAPQVADLIASSGTQNELESHRREITALFCDLRGFTEIFRTLGPRRRNGSLARIPYDG